MSNPRITWSVADYHPQITGPGARKLAASGIAPLVAAARGYSSVTDVDGAKALARSANLETGSTKLSRRLIGMVTADIDDLLTMPWFTINEVAEHGVQAPSRTTQFRPSAPASDDRGRLRKYEFLPGQRTTLDVHPATPKSWISVSPLVVITEGIIKADSGLTAMLVAAGVTKEELAIPDGDESAREVLQPLMERVPEDRRALLVAVAGVGNWHSHPEWNALILFDRNVGVAFDGDVRTNPAVHKQARDLFAFIERKRGVPALVDLDGPAVQAMKADAGVPESEKIGLDDFLTTLGSWDDVPTLLERVLPDRPEGEVEAGPARENEVRIDPERPWMMQEFAREQNVENPTIPGPLRWLDRCAVGGRVVAIETRRRPTPEELSTGIVDPASDRGGEMIARVEVTIGVPGEDGQVVPKHYEVTGPAEILLVRSPAEWRGANVRVPEDVLGHEMWPPLAHERRGLLWLKAVKAYRPDERRKVRVWDQMGWVPDGSGWGAMVVGNTVVARDEIAAAGVIPGITEANMPGAERFGVIDIWGKVSLEAWKAQIAADIRTVMDAYVENGPWKDKTFGLMAVAAMVRPAIPVRPITTIYVDGPPGSGKSHWASFVMSGWQRHGGTWTPNSLPGAAGDSAAAMTDSVSRCPIWVADDLAPDPSRGRQESKESAVSEIVRSVHNGSYRRRIDVNTGRQQMVSPPISLLVLTAENGLDSASIVQRTIRLQMKPGDFADNERVRHAEMIRDKAEPAAARVVAAMARIYLQPELGFDEFRTTWAGRVQMAEEQIESGSRYVRDYLNRRHQMSRGDSARQVEKINDLSVAINMLRELYRECMNFDPVQEDEVSMRFEWAEGGYQDLLADVAMSAIERTRRSTPGRNLLTALRDLLNAGHVYVGNPVEPSQPPMSEAIAQRLGEDFATINQALGWRMDGMGTWTPKGIKIGELALRENYEPTVSFAAAEAFSQAASRRKDLILPGQKQASMWSSVYSEELAAMPHTKGGHPQIELPGRKRLRGIPVSLRVLMDDDNGAEAGSSNGEAAVLAALEQSFSTDRDA